MFEQGDNDVARTSNPAEKVMVALDYKRADEAEQLLTELAGIPCYVKVGMQLYFAEGPRFVERLKERGYRVFLDLKMHDIPNTVKGAADSLTRLGVDMFNVHAAGGIRMMEAAMEGVSVASMPGRTKPAVIAVTHLTSVNQTVLNDEIGIPGSVESAVLRYASLVKRAGLTGTVSSPWEARAIKKACGANFITVTPGIRPAGSDKSDQARTMTPADAFAAGSDYIVIGRPITAAARPRLALEQILKELI